MAFKRKQPKHGIHSAANQQSIRSQQTPSNSPTSEYTRYAQKSDSPQSVPQSSAFSAPSQTSYFTPSVDIDYDDARARQEEYMRRRAQQQGVSSSTDSDNGAYYQRSNYGSGGRTSSAGMPVYPDDVQSSELFRDATPRQNGDGSFKIPESNKRKRRWPKRVLVFVLLLVLIVGGPLTVYNYLLEQNMRPSATQYSQLEAVLQDSGFEQPCYTLLLGSDTRVGTEDISDPLYASGNGDSDVIILIRTDPKTETMTLVSIPRDTPITVNGEITKINRALSSSGPAATVSAVQDITGVKISHFVQMSFVDVASFVDALGGIDVTVPMAIDGENILDGDSDIRLQAGLQHLDGEHALFLARHRASYEDNQEAVRQSNIRNMIEASVAEFKKKPLYSMPGLGLDLSKCFTSDINLWDLLVLGAAFFGKDMTMYSASGPYEGDFEAIPGNADWFCYPDSEGWADLMAKVDAGVDPNV